MLDPPLFQGYVARVVEEIEKSWTVQRVVTWTADDLKKRGIENARLDAELIVAYALKIDRIKVLIEGGRSLDPAELEVIRALVKRRRAFEPIAYLRGEREFYGRPFRVDRRVLVPRPDTETLIEVALMRLSGRDLGGRILDLCTGSGCVAITLKCERPTIGVDAVDVSEDAIAVARVNAQRLGAVWAVRFLIGDLFAPLRKASEARAQPSPRYDLIVANPPYIATDEVRTLQPDIRDHEPHLALDGGHDGLALVRKIIEEARSFLVTGGALALELGAGEAPTVSQLLQNQGWNDVRVARDYGGHDRVVSALNTS
ncbi:MAG: peptide chain release factor N(5)-glutamine methyltransferase [Polyangiales bacterium]